MKRSIILMVCNGGSFITHQLSHIYDVADEIIIIEGADANFRKIIGAIRSTDDTLKQIEDFISTKDPAKKIKLILGDYPHKNAIVRAANSHCSGDYIYHVDVDEFLTHDVIDLSFNMLQKYDCILIPERWYYKWPDVYLRSGRPTGYQVCPGRFFKNKIDSGLSIGHIPWNGYYDKNFKHHTCSSVELAKNYYGYHFLAIYRYQLVHKMQYYVLRGDAPESVIQQKLGDFDVTKKSHVGNRRIPSYDNHLLMAEENPIAIFGPQRELIMTVNEKCGKC